MIEVQKLSKRFKKFTAVDDVSFTACDGEILGLLGANGAGKTTTLRIISATMRPSSGTVCIGGFDVVRQPDSARSVLGVMPENWGMYGHLTARDHLRFFGRLYGMKPERIEQRIKDVVELLQMQEYIDRSCEQFSKGMKQKVSLARTLLHEPGNFLLDEPTSGLDVMSARHVREIVTDLKKKGGCVILSTHILGEAERLCDRIIIMDRARKVAQGTVAELCQQSGMSSFEDTFISLIGHEDTEVVR
jgi:sodium transport system ATP-binding protein